MATSAWSTEAWTDTQQSPGGVTDLSKLYWTADWSAEADGYSLAGSQGEAYGIQTAIAKVSSVRTLNGRKSAIETYGPFGSDKYPVGFEQYVPLSVIPDGEETEVWFRVWIWHETGYSFYTAAGLRKTMRMGEYWGEDYDGSVYGGGFCDIYTINQPLYTGWEVGGMMHIRETDPGKWVNIDRGGAYKFEFGKWECLEYYVKASHDPARGVVKVWRDGALVNSVVAKTRVHSDSRLCRIAYISNWNRGLNKEVTQSWCAPAIAVRSSTRDDTPFMARDSQGFPYIGTAT